MRLVLAATALVVAMAPAAEAKRAGPKCPRAEITSKAKPRKACRKAAGGRSASAVRVSMTRGGLQGPVTVPTVENPPPPSPTVARLGVTAREWSLVLSRATLSAGPARVQLQNLGEDAHNLRIEHTGGGAVLAVPLAESGERSDGQGTLAAGSYKVYCALPGHEAAGMRARLSVSP
jgi:plastocyanin